MAAPARYFASSQFPVESLPYMSTWDFIFSDNSTVDAGKLAYIDDQSGERLSWEETRLLAVQLAKTFATNFSLEKGDVVALVSSNSIYIPAFVLAAQVVGIICSPVSAAFSAPELDYQIFDSGAKRVFCGKNQQSLVQGVCERRGLPGPVLIDKSDDPRAKTIWSFLLPGISDARDFAATCNPFTDVALLCYSSGTSGKPKGVYTTHYNITSAHQQALQATPASFTKDEVWIASMPMTHMYTLFFHVFVAMKIGATVVIMNDFSLDRYVQTIKRFRVTLGHIVPPIAVSIVQDLDLSTADFTSLREWRSAAAPLAAELAQSLERKTNVPVHCLYGMTEATAGVAYSNSSSQNKAGSVGLLSPNIQVKLVDGELRIKGPNVMLGYHNYIESPFDEEGYLMTGDRVHIDADGSVFVIDRVKELIKYNGFQVPPIELEEILLSHQDVKDAAVIGTKDDWRGTELPRAVVVLRRPPGNIADLASQRRELVEFVQSRVADHKRLRGGVVFVDSIPRSTTGKILRRLLRDENESAVQDNQDLYTDNPKHDIHRASSSTTPESANRKSQLDAPIAIVGIAAQLPSGTYSQDDLDYDTFWELLASSSTSYEKLDQLNITPNPFLRANAHEKQVLPERGSFLKHISELDYVSLGISKRDAQCMPLSTRRLLELSFRALQDSGIDSRGQEIGCFMCGSFSYDIERDEPVDGNLTNIPSAMANRVSYALNLRGPSMFIDTACSSSLTALRQAIISIASGDCSAALVGACQVNRRLSEWVHNMELGVLSKDGLCKPFDATADGFARGEGGVVVVIKPLEDALKSGDHIYATILGSSINDTGSAAPLYVPHGPTQQSCLLNAATRAGINVNDIDYLETHCTGTSVGDPIEINAAAKLFSEGSQVSVGSVKANLGHLESTAFLVSLVKTCLMLEKRTIPPNVPVQHLNPAMDWKSRRLQLEPHMKPLSSRSGRSIISISSLGIGGSTGNVIISSPPDTSPSSLQISRPIPPLCVVGGLSPHTCRAAAEALQRLSSEQPDVASSMILSQSRRARQLLWRTSFLTSMAAGSQIPEPILVPQTAPPIVFVFSGQGPQNLKMGRQLFAAYPVFQQTILELDAVYQQVTGRSLMQLTGLFGEDSAELDLSADFWPVRITLPALLMVHAALVDLLKSLGIEANSIIGHSAGETSALYGSGAGSKEMAMKIAIARGEAMSLAEAEDVGMASFTCDEERVAKLIYEALADESHLLSVSCYNAAQSVVISGPGPLLEICIREARSLGFNAQRLRTRVPGHSSHMDKCQRTYESLMEEIFAQETGTHRPRIPVFSTSAEEELVDHFSPHYYWENCRRPVRFGHAVENCLKKYPSAVFLEISPHPVLVSAIEAQDVSSSRILGVMRKMRENGPSEMEQFLRTLGQLCLLGVNSLDLRPLCGAPSLSRVKPIVNLLSLRQVPLRESKRLAGTSLEQGSLADTGIWLSKETSPFLYEHVVSGAPVMPAAGMVEIILRMGANTLWDIEFKAVLVLPTASNTAVRIMPQREHEVGWTLSSSLTDGAKDIKLERRCHAIGCFSNLESSLPCPPLDLADWWSRLPCVATATKDIYRAFPSQLSYGPSFQRLLCIHGNFTEAIAEVRGIQPEEKYHQYILHPALLDACIHVLAHPKLSQQSSPAHVYLPASLERFVLHRSYQGIENWITCLRLKKWEPDQRYYDVDVTDSSGHLICSFHHLLVRKSSLALSKDSPVVAYDYVFRLSEAHDPRHTVDLQPDDLLPAVAEEWFTYKAGSEMELQAQILSLDPAAPSHINIIAQAGPAGHLALGLCASLRVEFINWRIHLILLHPSLVLSDLKEWISAALAGEHAGEDVISISQDRTIYIPRLLQLDPIEQEQSQGLVESSPPALSLPEEQVLVAALDTYTYQEINAFVGRIIRGQDPSLPLGSIVAGVAPHQTSKLFAAPLSSLTVYPGGILHSAIHVMALVVASLAAGTPRIMFPERVHPSQNIAIHLADPALTQLVEAACNLIPSFPKPTPTIGAAREMGSVRIHLVLSDESSNHINSRCLLAREGNILRVDRLLRHLLLNDPWALQLALDRGMAMGCSLIPVVSCDTKHERPTLDYLDQDVCLLPALEGVGCASDCVLFNARKSYLVVGGIGGLGIDLAVWLYQNGARSIYLTSRRGLKTLQGSNQQVTMFKIKYLLQLPDLDIHFQACDATDLDSTKRLVEAIGPSLGGCFVLTMQLRDALFVNQTALSFTIALDSKIKPIEVLEMATNIQNLDFLIAFSSIAGLIGNNGQTNYAAANTALNAKLASLPNATSIVVPAIVDTGYLLQAQNEDMQAMSRWGITSEELFDHVENALRRLQSSLHIGQYIPDLRWNAMASQMPLPRSCRDLVTSRSQEDVLPEDSAADPVDVVLKLLDLVPGDFDPNLPLTAYGLDSISAARISRALKPFGTITSMVLLSNETWNQIQQRLRRAQTPSREVDAVDLQRVVFEMVLNIINIPEEELSPAAPLSVYGLDSRSAALLSRALRPYIRVTPMELLGDVSWDVLGERISIAEDVQDHTSVQGQSHEMLIPLSDGVGIPMVFLHDLSGSIAPILPLRHHLTCPLWAIQVTPAMGIDSLQNLVEQYYRAIKSRIPHGPYHIATFSASSIIGTALVKKMEAMGDTIVAFSCIDHFPVFWLCRPVAGFSFPDSDEEFEVIAKVAAKRCVANVIDLLRWDENETRARYADEVEALQRGGTASEAVEFSMETIRKLARLNLQFLLENAGGNRSNMDDTLLTWLGDVRAPISVFVASRGIVQCVPEWAREKWWDLGASRCAQPIRVVQLDAGHFQIMEHPELASLLQGETQTVQN